MMVQVLVWLLLVLSCVVALAIGSYVWMSWRTRAVLPLVLMFGGIVVWSLGYLLQLFSPSLSLKLLFARVVATGSVITITGWFIFVLEYTGRGRFLTRPWLVGICLIPALTIAFAWTNGLHGLIWTEPQLRIFGNVEVLSTTPGPWFRVTLGYGYLLVLVSLVLIIDVLAKTASMYRSQATLLLVATLVPLLGSFLFYATPRRVLIYDLTPVLFSITGVMVAYSLSRYRLLDLAPLPPDVVLKKLADPVIVLDPDHRIRHINDAEIEQFDGLDSNSIGTELTTQLSAVEPLLEATPDEERRQTICLQGNSEQWLDVKREPLIDHRSRVIGSLLSFRDITDQKRREQQLLEQNDTLEAFTSVVSHDLQGPLMEIRASATVASRTGDLSHVDDVLAGVDRMDQLVDELLALARSGQRIEETEPVELASVVHTAWRRTWTGDANIRVDASMTIHADTGRLQQLLENLFRNSVEHGTGPHRSDKHNSIDGSSSNIEVRVGTLEDGNGFYVEDDGCGFPLEDHHRLFERGYTSSDDGTGIGLAIVKQIVAAHGWTITATEGQAGGARFEITGVETPS